jgi:hypothetical protein
MPIDLKTFIRSWDLIKYVNKNKRIRLTMTIKNFFIRLLYQNYATNSTYEQKKGQRAKGKR